MDFFWSESCAFSEGEMNFILGEDLNQFFPNITIVFNKIPKFRWGSILQFSPVPPSLLMLQNTLRLRSRMIVNTTCQFLLKTSLLFQPFIRERCSSKRNEGNLSFRKCFRWQQRKLFHLFGKNTTATIKTRLIWRFQNPASSFSAACYTHGFFGK